MSEPSPPSKGTDAPKKRTIIKTSTKGTAQSHVVATAKVARASNSASTLDYSDAPCVSAGPDLFEGSPSIPVFAGTVRDKLESCLDALNPSNPVKRPTFTSDKKSMYRIKMKKIMEFVQATLMAECLHGGREGKSAALYCCGPPGIGKTSGILWCCEMAVASWDDDESPKPVICDMNASEQSWGETLNGIGTALGMKSKITEVRVMSKLRTGQAPLLLVVDEIDEFLSGSGSKAEGLSKLLQWANDDECHFALIGISNSMNDEKAHKMREANKVRSSKFIHLSRIPKFFPHGSIRFHSLPKR